MQTFFKGWSSLSNLPAPVNYKAIPIEHKLVLAANLVDINHWDRAFTRSLSQQFFTFNLFTSMERRGIQSQHKLRAGTASLAKRFWEPDIFTNTQRNLHTEKLNYARLITRHEVALFIEHSIVWKLLLVVASNFLAICEYPAAVIAMTLKLFVARSFLNPWEAHYDRNTLSSAFNLL
ncbi:hypothetical protein D3C76_832690 [compost metagenome]